MGQAQRRANVQLRKARGLAARLAFAFIFGLGMLAGFAVAIFAYILTQ